MISSTLFTVSIGLLLSTGALSAVVKLNDGNYEALTSKKAVFIKFFAPWCGHCQAMTGDWERLAAEWANSETGLVAEVDCDDDASALICDYFNIEGFPTLMYGNPRTPEPYEGGRDFKSMSAFAKTVLTEKPCSIEDLDSCSPEVKSTIEGLMTKPKEELEKMVAEIDKKLAKIEDEHEDDMQKLQNQFDALVLAREEKVKKIRVDSGYNWLKMVLSSNGSKSFLDKSSLKSLLMDAMEDDDDDDDEDDDGDDNDEL
ncbi:hypothetical protein ACA910_002372 [Epithemia clementina (nom. ined.)]